MDDFFSDYMDVGEHPISAQVFPRVGHGSAQCLSHDVLHCIFTFCNEAQYQVSIVLAQVCRPWRFSALASPFLLTDIRMVCHRRHPHHNWVKTCLKRARGLPINLTVNSLRPFEEEELNTVILANS